MRNIHIRRYCLTHSLYIEINVYDTVRQTNKWKFVAYLLYSISIEIIYAKKIFLSIIYWI